MPRFQSNGDESKRRQALRILCIGSFLVCAYGAVMCRAILFHLKDNAKLEKVAMRQYQTLVKESTKRGKILDVTGRELAVNVQAKSFYADPRKIEKPLEAAQKLSRLLGVSEEKLYDRFRSKRKFVWVKRLVDPAVAKEVRALHIAGLGELEESKRQYPNQKLASTLLGAVGLDAQALGGVELQYNDYLTSSSTSNSYRRDARGQLYFSSDVMDTTSGVSELRLTIDKTLQYIAEKELSQMVEKQKAKGGIALVLDPHTGDLLAMANNPSFDPNEYRHYKPEFWKNRAITDAYEPGSTMKVMVIASALERNLVTSRSVFDCENGRMAVGKRVVRDTHAYGNLSVFDILRFSSNIGAAKVGKKFSPDELYTVFQAWGFGRQSGVGLPAESVGILASYKSWPEIKHVTVAFGQGVSTTPLQMAMAFAAVANGGELLKPNVVKRIISEEGELVYEAKREVVSRPIQPKTAQLVTEMLKSVTLAEGTGVLAASQEYPVAGKTGTAQKADPHTGGYATGKYFSSFIGFAPADDPKIVVYVGIDEPGAGEYYGGQVAGPVFKNIVEASLRYLKVPSELDDDLPVITADALSNKKPVPQSSYAHAKMKKVQEGKWEVPSLQGLTMRGVLDTLKDSDIKLEVEGSGLVISQYPKSGAIISEGQQLKLSFGSLL